MKKYLKDVPVGGRFRTALTKRTGTVIEHGSAGTTVQFDGKTLRRIGDTEFAVPNHAIQISSMTETEELP